MRDDAASAHFQRPRDNAARGLTVALVVVAPFWAAVGLACYLWLR